MKTTKLLYPSWLISWMQTYEISLWGAADLRVFETPKDDNGLGFPIAISFAWPMSPPIMAGIQKGPNKAYADEYARINKRINDVSNAQSKTLISHGIRSQVLAASERTDKLHNLHALNLNFL
jgi:hypothetical protein